MALGQVVGLGSAALRVGAIRLRAFSAVKYRPEIDGLRALAVVPVILFHAGFGVFSGGFVGVDVFFVISGYLISTIIMTEMAAGRFTLAGFYERRARRILPAMFLVMLACLPFAWAWMVPLRLEDFGQSLVAVAAFASNMLFWQESGYFSPAAEFKPLLHTWSLAIEEQFYVLFPAFMLLCWRFGPRMVAALVLLAALASLGLSEWVACSADGTEMTLALEVGRRVRLDVVPTTCVADLDDDGRVGIADLLALFAVWGPCPGPPGCPGDFNCDGTVGIADMLIMFANWGPCG